MVTLIARNQLQYVGSINSATGSDITTELQALINDTTIAEIFLPPGSFNISQTITIDRALILRGSGSCAAGTKAERVSGGATGNAGEVSTRLIYTATDGTNCIEVVGSGTEGLENVHIYDIMITGNASAGCGLVLASNGVLTKSSFTNIFIEDFTNTATDKGNGLQIRDCYLSTFQNFYVHGCRDGINIYGLITSLNFQGVYSRVNTRYGLLLQQSADTHLMNLVLEGNASSAVKILARSGRTVASLAFGPGFYTEQNCSSVNAPIIDIASGGSTPDHRDIVFYRWTSEDQLGKKITAATQANPCQITAASHGFSTGNSVTIRGVVGMTELNDNTYTITVVDPNTFTLDGINSSGYTAYSSGGVCNTLTQFAQSYVAFDGCDYVRFYETVLGDWTANFASCTSSTTSCLLSGRSAHSYPLSNVTNNAIDSNGDMRVMLSEPTPTLGSWTVTAVANVTITGQANSNYIRHGNHMRCWSEINISAISGSAIVSFGGLPFNARYRSVTKGGSSIGGQTCDLIDVQTDGTVDVTFSGTWSGGAQTFYLFFEYYI